jgi:hypothetical protein
MMNHQPLSSFIWSVAHLLRSPSCSADAQWPSVTQRRVAQPAYPAPTP